jgi:hypothetical protein
MNDNDSDCCSLTSTFVWFYLLVSIIRFRRRRDPLLFSCCLFFQLGDACRVRLYS